MKSSPHGPYVQGYTRDTMAGTKSCDSMRWAHSSKAVLRSNCSQLRDSMKLKALEIENQHAAVNPFLGLVHTARHTTRFD